MMDEGKKMRPEEKKIHIELSQSTVWKAATVILAVLFVISLFTGGFGLGGTGAAVANVGSNGNVQVPTQQPNPTQGQQQVVKAQVDVQGEPCMGDEDADVQIVEFSDYQCPFCQRAFQQTFPEIKKLVDSGDVRYCFKDYPLPFHEQADEAAIAANCAGAQGKYWEMHEKLFTTQGSWSGNTNVASVFTGYAKELGLDESQFNSCVTDAEQKSEVDGDTAEGSAAGVSGTPTSYINGQQVVGAQPWAAFKAIIDAELTK